MSNHAIAGAAIGLAVVSAARAVLAVTHDPFVWYESRVLIGKTENQGPDDELGIKTFFHKDVNYHGVGDTEHPVREMRLELLTDWGHLSTRVGGALTSLWMTSLGFIGLIIVSLAESLRVVGYISVVFTIALIWAIVTLSRMVSKDSVHNHPPGVVGRNRWSRGEANPVDSDSNSLFGHSLSC